MSQRPKTTAEAWEELVAACRELWQKILAAFAR